MMRPMKKTPVLLLLTCLLSACTFSTSDLAGILSPATATPAEVRSPTGRVSPSETPTFTATIPTSTFTLTPTLVGLESTLAETGTPPMTPTFMQLILGNSLTQTSFVEGFVSILLSVPVIYWGEPTPGSECAGPHAQVFAQVSNPIRISHVSLFMRLKSKLGSGTTDWDSGALMENRGNGTFAHVIDALNIERHENYADAWVQMQFVSTDADGRIIDRTPVLAESLGLAVCP
jgi:hypothetical protein